MSEKKINKIKVIAEVAQGYEGDFTQSKLFVKAASSSKADAVKFQLVYADELCTKDYKYYDLFKSLEMPFKNWNLLNDYANELKIEFIVDIFGLKSLEVAEKLDLKSVKVHATDLTNLDLIKKISNSKINSVILGVGGAFWYEIEEVLKILKNKKVEVLLGFQGYPTKTEDNHIRRLLHLKIKVAEIHNNFQIGFAPHPGENDFQNILSLTAIGAGAQIIEKHLTLGKIMKIEDYESALNPDEFYEYIKQLKFSYLSFGEINDFQKLTTSEENYRNFARKDVVAAYDIKKGTILNSENLTLKRTGLQGAIKNIRELYGKKLFRTLKKDEIILKSSIY